MPTDPHALSDAYGDQIIVNQQWTNDAPPDILERYRKNIVVVQQAPTDRVTFATYVTSTLTGPVQIVGRQPEGIACKVTITLIDAFGDNATPSGVLLGRASDFGTGKVDNSGNGYMDNGYTMYSYMTVVLNTRSEIWAAAIPYPLNAYDECVFSVMQEHYDIG